MKIKQFLMAREGMRFLVHGHSISRTFVKRDPKRIFISCSLRRNISRSLLIALSIRGFSVLCRRIEEDSTLLTFHGIQDQAASKDKASSNAIYCCASVTEEVIAQSP